MIAAPAFSRFNFQFDNWGADPSNTPGTQVFAGLSDAEGDWTQIASGTDTAQDIYALLLLIFDGRAGGVARNHLLDIGVDPAGGTTYTPVVSDIVCGGADQFINAAGGISFSLPLFIRAGSSVAVRVQGSHTAANFTRVAARFYGAPSRPELTRAAQYSETIGVITGSQGVAFTPGNAADGAWQLLGTTTRALWWWQIAFQVSNTTMSLEYTYVEIAHGDASNKHVIMRTLAATTANEARGAPLSDNVHPFAAYCPVPAGTNIYIRGRCNTAPNTGYNAVAIGLGG